MVIGSTVREDALGDAVIVEKSALGKRWQFRATNDRDILTIQQRYNLPDIIARILSAREVDIDAVEPFLNPTIKDFMPDPSSMKDMGKAVSRVVQAIERDEGIAVFGDYDVDGATSTAVLVNFFKAIGVKIQFYIPDRLDDGYGPNIDSFRELKQKGAKLIITADCGVSSFDPLAAAKDEGIDIVVLDHHVALPELPVAEAIVNPNRLDDESGLGYMSAAGVCFMFLVALNRQLRKSGYYDSRPEPNLMNWLDLVALGTICDVVPLVGLNRAFVSQGLKVMMKRQNLGLRTLADLSRINDTLSTYHLGFVLGPRINAGGRVGKASYGARLLVCEDVLEAQRLARGLDEFNQERRKLESVALEQAKDMVERGDGVYDGLILLKGEDWHPGVVGIVAGRLKELYQLPTAVTTLQDGNYKGSARSVKGLSMGDAVIAAKQKGLALSGGGHPMAAGFTVAPEKFDEFAAFLSERFSRIIKQDAIVPQLEVDCMISTGGASIELVEAMAQLQPFGMSNPQPCFVLNDVRLSRLDVVGQDHLKCTLKGSDGKTIKAMAFRAVGSNLGRFLSDKVGDVIQVAGTIREDLWGGSRNVLLTMEDAAAA